MIITIADAPQVQLRPILSSCERIPVRAQMIPAMHDLLQGRVSISELREAWLSLSIVTVVGDEAQAGSCWRSLRVEKDHDYNPDVILKRHEKALGLCYYCLAPATGIVADICRKCRVETGCSEQDLTEWRTRRSSWAIPEKPRGATRGRASRAGRTPERPTRSGRRWPGR